MDNSSPDSLRITNSSNLVSTSKEKETDGGFSVPNPSRSSFEQIRSTESRLYSLPTEPAKSSSTRNLILKSFLPRVAVYASEDTEELIRLKGIYGGLSGLLRPFGENVPGKVGIRDSFGLSKSWDEYGVHFVQFERERRQKHNERFSATDTANLLQEGDWSRILKATPEENKTSSSLDKVVQDYMKNRPFTNPEERVGDESGKDYYELFLRKVLSERPLSPHETFSHPVACIVAISSQTSNPISTLGELYHDTRAEGGNLPNWVNSGFLRYYLLVHDEDNDDIATSTGLFAQMKRHFGLHCYMLRLRSVECTTQDPEGNNLPRSQWLCADDDVDYITQKQQAVSDELNQRLFHSDATVIRAFVRELVTQSIVPYMETRVTTWNDQIASRRRGVTGRLMSMSKKWTGFGSVRGRNSPAAPADRDFDPNAGAYKPESTVATMHRLADYAFMLRDWKLSSSVYDMLRSDFSDDKAWHHYAAAHEMAAFSLLLTTQNAKSKTKVETINQLLDTASYSFITRCSSPREASRCMIVAMELYIGNGSLGGLGNKEAVRWGKRLLELSILSPLTQAILTERLAVACRPRSTFLELSTPEHPYRKSALWSLLAADSWAKLGEGREARQQLEKAKNTYGNVGIEGGIFSFKSSQVYLELLGQTVDGLEAVAGSTEVKEPDTFVENLLPMTGLGTASSGNHMHSSSNAHRRRPSQSHCLAAASISRQEDPVREEDDDGFS